MTSKKVPFQIGDRCTCTISIRGRSSKKAATITEILGEKAKILIDGGQIAECFVRQLQRLDPYPKVGDRLIRMPYKGDPRISCTVMAIVNGEARAATGDGKLTEYNVSTESWSDGLFVYEQGK